MPTPHAVVDGLTIPAPLAGSPALELCNTYVGWTGGRGLDYLETFDHLALWSAHVGLLDAAQVAAVRRQARRSSAAAAGTLDRALRLRAPLYRLFQGAGDAADWDALNRELRDTAPFLRLRSRGRGAEWSVATAAGVTAPVVSLTWTAAAFLASGDQESVRACPGGGCGRLFLDRRGTRRWCAMEICGNRAKARRFAERRRPAA